MELDRHWNDIRQIVKQALIHSKCCSLVSVNKDGSPHVAPVGSLCLGDDCNGFYFEMFMNQTVKNFEHDKRICVMAINSSHGYWFKSLLKGKFTKPYGVRLYGRVGEKREATEDDIQKFRTRINRARFFKGHDLLWKDLNVVRDIQFDRHEPINLGVMGNSLWK